ncbi:MAG: CvpA family protein [Sphingomonadaceae bacterium]|nr:CvpA family protein [Sphingomonadaceae bacterium]
MLTALDVIVLLLVGGGGVLGWLKGFVTEILSLFAWIAAIIALKLLYAPAAALLTHKVGTGAGAAVLAFALVFGIVFLLGRIVAGRLGRRTRESVLGTVDRMLGLGFGALKGLIGATLLFLVASFAFDTVYGGAAPRPAWMTQSRSYPLLRASGHAIVDFVQARRALRAEGAGDADSNAAGGDNSTDATANTI